MPDFGPVRRTVEMLKQLQMGMRAFLLMASRVWTCICFLLKKQVRAVSRRFAPLFAPSSALRHESHRVQALRCSNEGRRRSFCLPFFYRDTDISRSLLSISNWFASNIRWYDDLLSRESSRPMKPNGTFMKIIWQIIL